MRTKKGFLGRQLPYTKRIAQSPYGFTCVIGGICKRPVYIFVFGEYNSKQVNVSGIQHFLAQFQGLELRTENFNAANIYLSEINPTTSK